MEAVLKREITNLGYEIASVEDGRVTFIGDLSALCRANIFLRTAERVLIKIGSFHAETFEELFQGTKSLPWEDYIPEDGKFWVAKAASVKSKLFSPSDIQSIMKKAMVERLKSVYHMVKKPSAAKGAAPRTHIQDTVSVPTQGFSRKYSPTATITASSENTH